MSGLLGNCLGSLAMYSTFEPRGLSKLTDYGDKGLRVSHEFLNLNLQVPQVSFPSDVVLRFLSALPISLMLRLQEGSVSPLTFLLARSTHQRLPFWQKDKLETQWLSDWGCRGGPDPKCSWHILAETSLVMNSARKLYKVQQINHENLKIPGWPKVSLGFSELSYRKTLVNFLANPINEGTILTDIWKLSNV